MLFTYKSFFQLVALFAIISLCAGASCKNTQKAESKSIAVNWWLTKADKSVLFQQQAALKLEAIRENKLPAINIDTTQVFQTIDGFGYTLTGGSAQHLLGMDKSARTALLKELFDTTGNNIGVSYLRMSIAASDLNDHAFSYDDLPEGQTDPEIKNFDFGPDRTTVIPVLKEILAINPHIKILGSPWSPPAWMKTNNDTRGGSLKPEFYDAYAKYLVKYIQEMSKEGIRIDAITIQNEPLHPGNNPSLLMLAEEQAAFIKKSLGPAFHAAGITTKLIVYDHNADRPDYPITILNDPEARKYVDGSAFHLYAGPIDALTKVHEAHPDKNLYFTEQWIGAPGNFAGDLKWHVNKLIIGATRNWAKTVLEWNLSSNPQLQPHTDRGGCDQCLGAVTIDGNKVSRNPAYYIIAHASKLVRPGSVRIASTDLAALPNVAFRTSEGKYVLIVLNSSEATQNFSIRYNAHTITSSLDAGAVATYTW